jgi:phosphoribosylformylglycinamidine cyclo-ligase
VHALAHITGGGLTDNIPRVLRSGLEVVLQRAAWPRPAVFEWLAEIGRIEEAEMYRTFNCGIGMIAIVASERADEALALLNRRGESAVLLGEVRRGNRGVVIESDR